MLERFRRSAWLHFRAPTPGRLCRYRRENFYQRRWKCQDGLNNQRSKGAWGRRRKRSERKNAPRQPCFYVSPFWAQWCRPCLLTYVRSEGSQLTHWFWIRLKYGPCFCTVWIITWKVSDSANLMRWWVLVSFSWFYRQYHSGVSELGKPRHPLAVRCWLGHILPM